MLRKFVAVTMAVSFVAMSTSGIMMMVIEKPSFTIQMHPVHKVFGALMTVAGIAHIAFNYRPLWHHLRARSVSIYSYSLVAVLVVLYGVAMNNKVPSDLAEQMDAAAALVEQHE